MIFKLGPPIHGLPLATKCGWAKEDGASAKLGKEEGAGLLLPSEDFEIWKCLLETERPTIVLF